MGAAKNTGPASQDCLFSVDSCDTIRFGATVEASESNHVLRILMHMVCLCSRCSQTVHAMDMEIMPLDRAKINVANVLDDNPVVLGVMDASNFSRLILMSIL